LSSFQSSNKTSPCPCCADSKGKCRTIETSFDLPITSSSSTLDGEMILCMREREDTQNYTSIGETKDGIWGKFVSNELSQLYKDEWRQYYGKENNLGAYVDDKARAERTRERDRERQARLDRIDAARKAHQRALLPEIERDREIRKVLNSLSISDRDYQNLTKRGFSHVEIIDNQYKTLQPEQPLREKTSQLLAGVTTDGMSLNNCVSGMILPIKNQRDLYIGWQHRPHVVSENGVKYYWAKTEVPSRDYDITSHTKETLELPLAYCQPNSGEITAKAIGLTEGIGFKAQFAANRYQQIVIGASGGQFAASTQNFLGYLDSASQQLEGSKNVVLYADAGAVKNPLVLRAYSRTTELLARRGYQVEFGWWNQIEKSAGDIDEISKVDGDSFSLISPSEFYTLGKQYSGWHPDDDAEIAKAVENPHLNEVEIAKKFANKLTESENYSSLQHTIDEFKHRYEGRYTKLKRLAWNNLEQCTKAKITATLFEGVQQQRIAKIAPIVADYLKLNKKYRAESSNTFIEYSREQKILTYIDKNNHHEFFRAKLSSSGDWKNLDSNISQKKEAYFLHEVKEKIALERSRKSSISEPKQSRSRPR